MLLRFVTYDDREEGGRKEVSEWMRKQQRENEWSKTQTSKPPTLAATAMGHLGGDGGGGDGEGGQQQHTSVFKTDISFFG